MADENDEQEWILLPLDQKIARRMGMPFRVPVPKEQFEGLANDGLPPDKLLGWIKDFFENAPVTKDGNWRRRNSDLVSQLEGYVDKQPLWKKAQELFAQNDFDKALKALKRITIMMPEDHATKLNYANALANQREYDKAYKQLKQIRESFFGESEYHVSLAQIHVAKNEHDQAIEELLVALEHKPDSRPAMDALAKLGVLAAIYENPRDATSLVYVKSDAVLDYLTSQWDGADHDSAYYLEQLGYHESDRRWEVALAAADRAARVGSGVVERAEQGRVTALRELGRIDQALAAARRYASEASGSAAAQVELSITLSKAGSYEEAKVALERALELDPGDQQALVLRFWPDDKSDMVKVQEALPALEKHADKHKDRAGGWRSLARAKRVVGADEEALGLFERAVGIAPGDEDLRSEWWGELAAKQRYKEVLDDAAKLGQMAGRDWRLRWNEAEAYRGLGRVMEARGCYMQINADESLHVDIRKRAKRAAMELGTAP